MTTFTKPPLTPEEHLQLFVDRGLIVPDEEKALSYIKSIGYFRLKSYTRHIIANPKTHELCPGTTFDQMLSFYVFDRKLRILTLDAIERIEVAVKAKLSGIIATHTEDAHWYLNRANFKDAKRHAEFLERCTEECGRCPDNYIKSYCSKYSTPTEPPCWMVFEVLPFGSISKLYENLDTTYQSLIANEFGLNRRIISSWLHSLSVMRNMCAHHHTIWNRRYTTTPMIPDKWTESFNKTDIDLYGSRATLCAIWLSIFIPTSTWRFRLQELIESFPHISLSDIGFYAPLEEIFSDLPIPLNSEEESSTNASAA